MLKSPNGIESSNNIEYSPYTVSPSGMSPILRTISLVIVPPESMVKVATASNASVSKELFVKVKITEKPSPGFRTPSLSSSLSNSIYWFAVKIGAPYKLFSIS